jgi:hypothetical protein
MKKILRILYLLLGIFIILQASDYDEIQKLVSSDRAASDWFGYSVSISGDYAIVGASSEDEDASGNNTLTGAGSAYIFKWDGTNWSQQSKLVADRAANVQFGVSVSISGDYAIVGANYEATDASGNNYLLDAGSAYIFKRDGTNWSQEAKLVASDRALESNFGFSVSISGDYAIVGAFSEAKDASGNNPLNDAGSAYIFKRDGTSWSQQAKLVASDRAVHDYFGWNVSISGDYAIVGAYSEDEDASGNNTLTGAGSAYIFKWDGTSWTQEAKLVASDRKQNDYFGQSVSISGDYAIIGAYYEDEDALGFSTLNAAGSAYIFNMNAPEVSAINIPSTFLLHQNYPNPFNPTTTLQYGLPEASDMDLMIFDVTGHKIESWHVNYQQPGWHEVIWNGTDMNGNVVSTGVYIYSLRAGNFVATKKMVYMK